MLQPLPIDEHLPELIDALRASPAAVLQAPPGAGKTTRVPPAVLDSGLLPKGQILMLQPRRVAARAAARCIAAERDTRLGGEVGYRIRFDRKDSKQTRILVVTEGILTRRFITDPLLEGVRCVILDEFHERSVHTDLALAFLRELLEVRDDLKLVVMSATLDAAPISDFLGGCPVVRCEGRGHPLTIEHAPEPLDRRRIEGGVVAGLRRLLSAADDDGGDVLCFLPGAPEIERARKRLAEASLPGAPELVPLYGALPPEAQDRALKPGTRRRIVLSTNIAETSLTIPGVTAVLDTGLRKLMRHDPNIGMDRLETVPISRSSADQRAGRAGRTAPGRALRLWPEHEHPALPAGDEPEIARIDLATVLLQVLAFHPGDPAEFGFFEKPPAARVEAALELLHMLGALKTGEHRLSDRGRRLAALPLHPRVGAMLERAAGVGLLDEAALLAALLGEGEILGPSRPSCYAEDWPTVDSDLLWRAELFAKAERRGFSETRVDRQDLNFGAAHRARRARDQILRTARKLWLEDRPSAPDRRDVEIRRMVLAGYPDRVCRRREPGSPGALMVGGRGVELTDDSGVREAELFVALDADAGRRGTHSRSRVRRAHGIEREDLEPVHPDLLSETEGAAFDPQRRSVVGQRVLRFADLELQRKDGVKVAPEVIAAELAEVASREFETIFKPDREARALLERLRFAALALQDEGWPDVGDEALRSWLPELCAGRHSLGQLEQLDWKAELLARLPWKLRARLDRDIPERVRVPSGSRIRIDYAPALRPDGAPVLAARMQELFGMAETPRIARGKVALMMHLLAPNGRPAQVTRDLPSFWSNTYPEVRKELRARYPKHDWPEDPWSATPRSRPGMRRRS